MSALLRRALLPVTHDALRLLAASQAAQSGPGGCAAAGVDEAAHGVAFSVGIATAAAAVAVVAVTAADSPEAHSISSSKGSNAGSWFSRLTGSSSSSSSAPTTQQQQQQWSVPSGEPLSGAIPMLSDDGLTNHPLDYNPITNEHTAAMTMAKQAGVEAYQAGRYSEAERRFIEALSEARLGFPPGDPHIPSAVHCLAELYRNTGRLQQAQELYEQAAADLLENLGEKHWMYAAALCSLAQCHEAKADYDQAVTLLEQALELRRQLFSDNSYLYADTASHLAAVLIKRQAAAASAAASSINASSSSSSSSSSSGGGGGWFGRGHRDSSAAAAAAAGGGGAAGGVGAGGDLLRAVKLFQQAVGIVEEAGHVEDTPAAAWLVELAATQTKLKQHAAAVDSLKKALQYMALPRLSEEQKQQQQQQQQQQSSGAGSSDVAAASDELQLQRLRFLAQGSEVCERLVDAQLAAGDLAAARATMREAVDARTVLYGRHLVVAKSMTRLSNLLMQPPPDPQAQQLAQHYAASAVAIAEHALQGAQRATLWSGLFSSLRHGSQKTNLDAEKASERLLAAMQLGSACLALAAAENMNGRGADAESALRKAVEQLRWVLRVGNTDVDRMTKQQGLEPALLERVAGLLVDLKLLQMDCLEALATAVQQNAAALGSSNAAAENVQAGGDAEEGRMLLGEAELLAAELYAD